jgi:hypothetical protein
MRFSTTLLLTFGIAVHGLVHPSTPTTPSGLLSRRQALQGATVVSGLIASRTASSAATTFKVPTVRLGSLEISRTIQGHWQLAGGHGSFRESDVLTNMKQHFDAGITTLDTADIYGISE